MTQEGSRNWCFTWNNYTDDDIEYLKGYKYLYLIFGKEVGESGTPHLQGYIEFNSVKLLKTLHKAFPKVHWEMRKGSQTQAITYCQKDNNFFEFGEAKSQGKRNDLIAVTNAIVEGTFKSTDFPEQYVQYHKGIEAFKASLLVDRDFNNPPKVIWRWGLAGVGKTRGAYEKHVNSVYVKDGTQWWDGYTQQEAIIIDDFCGKWPFRDLLRLLDRYPYQGQYKGGYVKINSPFIYITCEHPPEYFWSDNELAQITRRLHTIENVVLNDVTSEVTSEVGGNTSAHKSEISEKLSKCLL